MSSFLVVCKQKPLPPSANAGFFSLFSGCRSVGRRGASSSFSLPKGHWTRGGESFWVSRKDFIGNNFRAPRRGGGTGRKRRGGGVEKKRRRFLCNGHGGSWPRGRNTNPPSPPKGKIRVLYFAFFEEVECVGEIQRSVAVRIEIWTLKM